MLRISQKDLKLRNIQYKILHNIYPTMKHLFTWKIKDSPNCTLCNVPETLKHAIFECPVASNVWEHFKTLLNLDLPITYDNILLGFSTTNSLNLNRNKTYAIDTLLILLKQRLILQRENKIHINVDQIFSVISDRLRLEKYNSVKYNHKTRFISRWIWIDEIISARLNGT